MSQTVCITEVDGGFYPEILKSFPAVDEAASIICDMLDNGGVLPDECYSVVTEWYEIGDGESGTDTFFSDEELVEWYDKGGIDEIARQAEVKGYAVEHIQTETLIVDADYIEE